MYGILTFSFCVLAHKIWIIKNNLNISLVVWNSHTNNAWHMIVWFLRYLSLKTVTLKIISLNYLPSQISNDQIVIITFICQLVKFIRNYRLEILFILNYLFPSNIIIIQTTYAKKYSSFTILFKSSLKLHF